MSTQNHWDQVYGRRAADEVSWFQPQATTSLRLIRDAGVDPATPIIDVGAGASILVDDLLAAGFGRISVLDISAAAIESSRHRLGGAGNVVDWRVGDLLQVELPRAGFGVWHDRAVFHFFTAAVDRRRYVQQLRHALAPGGLLVIASFALDGPERCSGLPVVRYSADSLQAELGAEFALLTQINERHRTPAGNEQSFLYCVFRRSLD